MTAVLTALVVLLFGAGERVTSVDVRPAGQRTEVVIGVEGEARYRDFTLEAPARLVIDVLDAQHALPQANYYNIDRGGVLAVRTSQFSEDVVRVVVELDALVDYRIDASNGQLSVSLESEEVSFSPWSSESGDQTAAAPQTVTPAPMKADTPAEPIRISEPSRQPVAGAAQMGAPTVQAPAKVQAAAPASAPPARAPTREPVEVRIPMPGSDSEASMAEPVEEMEPIAAPMRPAQVAPERQRTAFVRKPMATTTGPIQQVARRITVSFAETPIQDVLFTFAEFSGMSIVAGSDVAANITADIRNQPWDESLQTILGAHGLAAREMDTGIIRVDNMENLANRETVEVLDSRTYKINYATANEISTSVQALMTERGRVSTGEGTNTVIVTDVPRVLDKVQDLVNELDVRTPMVNISAKIIFVNRTDLAEFGVTYDLKDSRGNQLNFLTPGAIDENGDGVIGADEIVQRGTDVVSLGGSSVAALGNANNRVANPTLSVLSSLLIGRYTLLNFIEALESVNMSDIQAAPSLTVMDNQPARVLVGERTPLRVVDLASQGGGGGGGQNTGVVPRATVELQETGIKLDVTPHVTAGSNILLDLRVERSAAELAESDAGFIFRTQEAESRVLVEDGETVVIAGLIVTERSEARSGIPILMNMPVVGRLFRVTREQQIQRDLIILVTPQIVDSGR